MENIQVGMEEVEAKLAAARALMAQHGLDALLLRKVSSFAWATGGAASYINTAVSEGAASLLLTRDRRYLLTDNIETPRLMQEEALASQGWALESKPWYSPDDRAAALTRGMKLGADSPYPEAQDLSGEVALLRANLLPVEQERFRELGRRCGEAMNEAVLALHPGQTEHEIASLLISATQRREAQATVALVATDQRVFNYRHPLPTTKPLERYVMLVLCGRWKGLVCSLTRLVHFGPIPQELSHKLDAVARVDGAMIAATRPGTTLGQVFKAGVEAYEAAGFPGEWKLHHQGGAAGYEPREYLGLPGSSLTVKAGQVFAWNPSITGVKSEDSILIGEGGNTVLTQIEGWPTLLVEIAGGPVERPAVLEVL